MNRQLACILSVGFVTCTFASFSLFGQDAKPSAADKWETDIRKFEEQAQKTPVPANANLFVGSSSIRLWKLQSSFPKHVTINRGFGGSQLVDSAKYAERLVIAAKPSVVVLYAGDNDIASGKSTEKICHDYQTFRDKIHAALPDTKIVVIAIKPSPSRWKYREQAQDTNRLLRAETEAGKNQAFVDIWPAMLNTDGQPRPELFLKDNLHMNEQGYKVWNELVEPHLVTKKE